MPAYADSLLAMIDSRVAAGQQVITRMGTVTERDSFGSGVKVIFDGSSGVAQPVKCFEDVLVFNGDRVGVIKVESDWIIFGNYTLYTLADVCEHFQWPSTATSVNPTTYVDMPNSPSAEFFKVRDSTYLRIGVELSFRSSFATTVTNVGVHVSSGSVGYDLTVARFAFNTANVHFTVVGTNTTPTADPSDFFVVTARWQVTSGTTPTLTVDSSDMISINVREVWQ